MTHGDADIATRLDELLALPAEQRLSRVRETPKADELILGLVDAAAGLTSAETARALDATAMMVALADEHGVAVARVRARRARARALSYAGHYAEALDVCRDAIGIATETGELLEAGRARLASMHALGELGRLDEAIAVGNHARDLFLSIDEPAFAARADINLGIAHQRHDQPAAALACFTRARPLLADEPLMLGHLENSRGEVLVALNRFADAERAFEQALEAFEQVGASLTAAIAEGNLADLAAREGRLQRALYYFEGARRHLEQDRSSTHLARLLAEQAEAKALLGLPGEALVDYERALHELDRCGLALEAARARSGMGLVLLRLGRRSEAETALAAAATAFDELGHATARAKVDLIRAEMALENGRAPEARAMAHRALSVLHGRPADAAAARLVLARFAIRSGEDNEALAELDAALAAARRLDLAPLLAAVLDERGRLHHAGGRLEEAVADLTEAVASIERVRGSLQAERFRGAYLGERSATHAALVVAVLEQGGDDALHRAFATAEQAKSRLLLDQIQRGLDEEVASRADDLDPMVRRLLDEHAAVQSQLNALYSRIADDRAVVGDASSREDWPLAVRQRETRLADIESRLATTRESNWVFGPSVSLADAQAHLGDDELLLAYFIADGEIMLFVADRTRARAERRLTRMETVAAHLRRIEFQINRALRPGATAGARGERLLAQAKREFGALYELLLAPVEAELARAGHVTIVPHGPLHVVPFHALWDGECYVIERSSVGYAPSASLSVRLRSADAKRPTARHPLVVGVADEIAPRIEAEARRVGALLSCPADRVLLGDEATTRHVAAHAGDASLIHLACHGRYLRDNPNASGVRLGDRWMSAREIARMRLRAELITLSGCETGLSRVEAGDELFGLVRSFIAAGTRSLLVSLWRIDDETAVEFSSRLYGSWHSKTATPGSVSDAVRRAQLALLADHPHPAFWAPFILIGRR